MRLPIYQVDAFAARVFTGNPAALVPLPSWLPDAVMQDIAAENNLAETAFFVRTAPGRYGLRWFTPAVEIDLCGHATLASAWLILNRLEPGLDQVVFDTRSGALTVRGEGESGRLEMDFPARPAHGAANSANIAAAMGLAPLAVLIARDYLLVYETAQQVRNMKPDMAALLGLEPFGVIVTAPGDEPGVDFVSRFFAPKAGIPEDPVTGSAHCTLTPYWAARLGKTRMVGYQASARGGYVHCRLDGERVRMAGNCVPYLEGSIEI